MGKVRDVSGGFHDQSLFASLEFCISHFSDGGTRCCMLDLIVGKGAEKFGRRTSLCMIRSFA